MLHVDVRLDTGGVSITPGPVNAAADEFYITVRGAGGRWGAPCTRPKTDPVAAVRCGFEHRARDASACQRRGHDRGHCGGYRNNVIAHSVKLGGTVRTTDPGSARCDGSPAQAHRGRGGRRLRLLGRTRRHLWVPARRQRPRAGPRLQRARLRETTPIGVVSLPPTMGAEDFADFAQRVPGLLVRLGVRDEARGAIHNAHSSRFRLDEAALPVGIATLVAFARGVGSGAVPLGS